MLKCHHRTLVSAAAIPLLFSTSCGGDDTADTLEQQPTSDAAATSAAATPDSPGEEEAAWFGDHLSVGDCWNDRLTDEGEFDYSGEPDVVPCAEPHDNEVTAVWTPEGADWPGDDALGAQSDDECGDAFATFVGAQYGTSAVDGFAVWPDEADWQAGARQSACSVYVDTVAVRGTLRDVGTSVRPYDFPVDAPIPAQAIMQRAGLTDEGDRLLAFDIDSTAEETVVALLAGIEAAGWEVGDMGAASRTTVIELSADGQQQTITVTAAPEDEPDTPVTIAYYYPAGVS